VNPVLMAAAGILLVLVGIAAGAVALLCGVGAPDPGGSRALAREAKITGALAAVLVVVGLLLLVLR
jgi:dihydrodipicolinate synthase/N-acetylneuraminate lyase